LFTVNGMGSKWINDWAIRLTPLLFRKFANLPTSEKSFDMKKCLFKK